MQCAYCGGEDCEHQAATKQYFERTLRRVDYAELSGKIPRPPRPLKHRVVNGEGGGQWLIPVDIPNVADWLHWAPPAAEQDKSQGYGGSTLSFALIDGTTLKVRGPWHSNAEHLFRDTGLDARDMHFTMTAIGRTRPDGYMVVSDIIHLDEAPVLGDFQRGEKLAQHFANLLGERVYFITASSGGGMGASKEPVV